MIVVTKKVLPKLSRALCWSRLCSSNVYDEYHVRCKSAKSVGQLSAQIADISEVGDVVLLTG